ncbi:MAG: hypothetical protein ACMUJM_12560 [bacterium]
MKIGKIITLVILAFLLYQYHEIALENARMLIDLYPLMQTYMEMSSYASQIASYVTENGEAPEDLSVWLGRNFNIKGDKDPGEDFFGTPYMVTEEDGEHIFRSCGRDGECHTEDDLVVTLKAGLEKI